MALFGPRALLMDSGSLTAQSYRAAVTNDDVSNDTELKPKHAVLATSIMFQSIMNMASNGYGYPIFVNDRYPTRKLAIYAKYKETRFQRYKQVHFNPEAGNKEVPDGEDLSLHQQFRQYIAPILNNLPVIQCYSPGEEADDAMKTAGVTIGRVSGTKLTLFTRDTDMFQMVSSPRMQILYKQPDWPAFIVTPEFVKNKYPTERPDQIPLYKCFLGDDGDSVPKIARMHEKVIVRDLIGSRSTVQEVFDDWWGDKISQDGWHKGWEDLVSDWLGEDEEQRGQAFINERLTRLKEDCNMVYEYTGGDYTTFIEAYTKMQAIAPWAKLPDGLQLWNACSHWANGLFKIFEKDGISVGNPGLLKII